MIHKPQLVPADTLAEAARVQLEAYRRMSPQRRLEMAFRLSDSLREFVAAGVRLRQPEWSEQQVRQEVARLFLGDKLFQAAYRPRQEPP